VKPCLPDFALCKPGYPLRLRENLPCEIPICVNRVYLFQLSRKPTFSSTFRQIIKAGRKRPWAPTTLHPSSKPPHGVCHHPVGYVREMLDASSTLLDYLFSAAWKQSIKIQTIPHAIHTFCIAFSCEKKYQLIAITSTTPYFLFSSLF
jgi:hypothetical protein